MRAYGYVGTAINYTVDVFMINFYAANTSFLCMKQVGLAASKGRKRVGKRY
jgi:hypothetical protein